MSQMDWLCKAQQKLFARLECLLVVTTFWDTTFWKRDKINVILTFLFFFGSAYIFWAQLIICKLSGLCYSKKQCSEGSQKRLSLQVLFKNSYASFLWL